MRRRRLVRLDDHVTGRQGEWLSGYSGSYLRVLFDLGRIRGAKDPGGRRLYRRADILRLARKRRTRRSMFLSDRP
jgi:hypothetical protein